MTDGDGPADKKDGSTEQAERPERSSTRSSNVPEGGTGKGSTGENSTGDLGAEASSADSHNDASSGTEAESSGKSDESMKTPSTDMETGTKSGDSSEEEEATNPPAIDTETETSQKPEDHPNRVDLVLKSSAMQEYEGKTIFAGFQPIASVSGKRILKARIENGGFELTWPEGWDLDTYAAKCVVVVDQDDDGLCTPGVDEVLATTVQTQLPKRTDATFQLEPVSATASSCAEFEKLPQ